MALCGVSKLEDGCLVAGITPNESVHEVAGCRVVSKSINRKWSIGTLSTLYEVGSTIQLAHIDQVTVSMVRKVSNKPLLLQVSMELAARDARQHTELAAKEIAKTALQNWYEHAYYRNTAGQIPQLQQNANLQVVALMQDWLNRKTVKNGYIMLRTLFGDEQPAILVLDYEMSASGGLSYRELHRQVREFLRLHRNVSLRMCPFRPWYLTYTPSPFRNNTRFLPQTIRVDICLERHCRIMLTCDSIPSSILIGAMLTRALPKSRMNREQQPASVVIVTSAEWEITIHLQYTAIRQSVKWGKAQLTVSISKCSSDGA